MNNNCKKKWSFNPSILNDEIAIKVSWEPLSKENICFSHGVLTRKSDKILEYDNYSTLFEYFLGFGIPLILIVLVYIIEKAIELDIILYTILHISIAIAIFFRSKKPPKRIFDNSMGFYKVLSRDYSTESSSFSKNSVCLSNVHALQILGHYEGGSLEPYVVYELNFVSKNGERVNIRKGISYPIILGDAKTISKFLGVPLWDTWEYRYI